MRYRDECLFNPLKLRNNAYICVSKLSHHWSSHYPNYCWRVVNWTHWNKFQSNFKYNNHTTKWIWNYWYRSFWITLKIPVKVKGHLHKTHPLMLLIICAKYGKNPSRTVVLYSGHHKMSEGLPYFSNFIRDSWLNDLEDIDLGQRSLRMTHPSMLAINCAKYGNNLSRTVRAVEWTWQDVTYLISFIAKSWLNDLEDIGH